VSVWVATSEQRTVKLDLWQGSVAAGTAEPPLASGTRETLRIGAALHVAVVTVKIEPHLAPLNPGTRYAYNVTLGSQDLDALGLLADAPQQPALGLGERVLLPQRGAGGVEKSRRRVPFPDRTRRPPALVPRA